MNLRLVCLSIFAKSSIFEASFQLAIEKYSYPNTEF